jgi:hypothetical protein
VANDKHSVDLSFHPRVESVSAVRRFLEVHYRRLVSNTELISRMAVPVLYALAWGRREHEPIARALPSALAAVTE